MSNQNKAVVQRFYDLLNQRDWEHMTEVMDANVIDYNPSPGQGAGLAGVIEALKGFVNSFPDMQVTTKDLIAEGDKVVVRGEMHGTHQGNFLGAPPTGKSVTMSAIDCYQLRDNRIITASHLEDTVGVMAQLGMLSPAQ